MIPFWNHRRIADLLRTRQLSERQRANFLIGGSALQIVLTLMTSFAIYLWFFLRLRRYMALASEQPNAAVAAA